MKYDEDTVTNDFEKNLEKYAEVIIRVGLNLQPGQRLVVTAPIGAAWFVRIIAAKAYQAGARLVDVLWGDEQLTLVRLKYAPRDSFEESSKWRTDTLASYLERGDALLSISAADPDLLRGQDTDLIATMNRVAAQNSAKYSELVKNNAGNWLVVSIPQPAWAAKVLPNLPVEEREAKLWDLIFEMSRVQQDDPVAGWQKHAESLQARTNYLNQKRYSALKYSAPGTNLTVGLPDAHIWIGAGSTGQNGIFFIPNIPTEEVFTMPHKDKVDGMVTATKPLSYAGTLIENFCLTFEAGRVINVTAENGEAVLRQILDTDEGARRLGEVALVPYSSTISQSGVLFYNTLFDENASSHVALGGAYPFTVKDGESMSEEQLATAG